MKPNFYHKDLSDDRWLEFSFAEQMANVGSEVERAINWLAYLPKRKQPTTNDNQ